MKIVGSFFAANALRNTSALGTWSILAVLLKISVARTCSSISPIRQAVQLPSGLFSVAFLSFWLFLPISPTSKNS